MRQVAIDIIGVLGFGSIVYGVHQWSAPAAWVVGGAIAVILAWGLSRK